MYAITSIEMVDESDYIPLSLKKQASIKVRIIIQDTDTRPNQIPAESLALAKMQEQTGFVKHVLGLAAEDVWNDL